MAIELVRQWKFDWNSLVNFFVFFWESVLCSAAVCGFRVAERNLDWPSLSSAVRRKKKKKTLFRFFFPPSTRWLGNSSRRWPISAILRIVVTFSCRVFVFDVWPVTDDGARFRISTRSVHHPRSSPPGQPHLFASFISVWQVKNFLQFPSAQVEDKNKEKKKRGRQQFFGRPVYLSYAESYYCARLI